MSVVFVPVTLCGVEPADVLAGVPGDGDDVDLSHAVFKGGVDRRSFSKPGLFGLLYGGFSTLRGSSERALNIGPRHARSMPRQDAYASLLRHHRCGIIHVADDTADELLRTPTYLSDEDVTVHCNCDPTRGHSCPACDGTIDEQETFDLAEPCIAVDGGELCDHRAEPSSAYCTGHQILDVARMVAA